MNETLETTLSGTRWNTAINLTDSDRAIVQNWRALVGRVKEGLKAGFSDIEITIEGTSIVGKDETRRPLQVLATVSYTGPDDKPGKETIAFMPVAVTLYRLFQVAGDETTRPTLDNLYVHLAPQARYGSNTPVATGPTGGIAENLLRNKPVDEDITPEELIYAAIREYVEEGIPTESKNAIPTPTMEDVHALGPAMGTSFLTDTEYQHYSLTTVNQEQFNTMRKALHGKTAGEKAETELTKPEIVSVYQAYAKALTTGEEGKLLGITRTLAQLGLLQEAAERFAKEYGTPDFIEAAPARNLQVYIPPLIKFDPAYQLDDTKRKAILESVLLAQRFEERHHRGFTTKEITIKGASFDEEGNPTDILVKADYWLPGELPFMKDPTGYHVVFRENTTRSALVIENPDNPQVLMQTQASFARSQILHHLPETRDLQLKGGISLGPLEGHPTPAMTEWHSYTMTNANNPGNKEMESIGLIEAFVRAGKEGAAAPLTHLSKLLAVRGELPQASAALEATLRRGPLPAACGSMPPPRVPSSNYQPSKTPAPAPVWHSTADRNAFHNGR
jgi:hypothetical protein